MDDQSFDKNVANENGINSMNVLLCLRAMLLLLKLNKVLTGYFCMPQNFMETQNHRFFWDLHHWTPLGRGLISQNIFGLRTVHMGVTVTLIFRLIK